MSTIDNHGGAERNKILQQDCTKADPVEASQNC